MERGISLKKRDFYRTILGILLLVYIGSMVMLNMISTDRVFSEAENRRLEQAPILSASQVIDGRFTTSYEKYVSDQFPLRDFWIGVKSKSEKVLGKKENNGVYLAKDGYLMEKFKKPKEEDLRDKVDEINSFFSNMRNVNMFFMLVPNSVKVLEDKLPPYAPVADELIYMDRIKESIDEDINFVDLYDALYDNKDDYIYYKTDHHWTTKGAYIGYGNLMKDMGIVPHSEDYFNIEKVTDSFYGSLYSKSGFRNIEPDSIELYIPKKDEVLKVEYMEEEKTSNSIYNMDSLNKKDKYMVFLGGNHPFIRIKTNIDNGKKLLIVKDSYANSLIPFLTGHFSEIYVVDPRYYDKDLKVLVEDEDIQDILILYNVNTFFERQGRR